jgi:hypothetical protein
MEVPSWLDEDIIASPAFWILGGGLTIAFLIGFKLQTSTDLLGVSQDALAMATPLWSKVIILIFAWIIAYGWVWKLQ